MLRLITLIALMLWTPDGDDSDDGGAGDGSTDDGASSGSGGPASKEYTQSQIDGMMARAQKKAASDARKSIEDDLGMSVSDFGKFTKDANAAADERLTSSERAERKAVEREHIADQRIADADARVSEANVIAALAPHMDRKAINLIAPTLSLPADATDDDVDDLVADLREQVPGLFTSSASSNGEGPGTTSQHRRKQRSTQTSEAGAEIDKFVENFMVGSKRGASELESL